MIHLGNSIYPSRRVSLSLRQHLPCLPYRVAEGSKEGKDSSWERAVGLGTSEGSFSHPSFSFLSP